MAAPIDLNMILAKEQNGHRVTPQTTPCVSHRHASVSIHFQSLVHHLCQFIRGADIVVGCVAWLTNRAILHALAHVPHGVSIIVQKEDFLRPDLKRRTKTKHRHLYEAIPNRLSRYSFPNLSGVSYCGDPSIEPIRCMGLHNAGRKFACPRMHHKFLVACSYATVPPSPGTDPNLHWTDEVVITPQSVWTGSFNFTDNGTHSRENAVMIESPEIARAYFDEWTNILVLSEPLDWETPWVEPEWRYGS